MMRIFAVDEQTVVKEFGTMTIEPIMWLTVEMLHLSDRKATYVCATPDAVYLLVKIKATGSRHTIVYTVDNADIDFEWASLIMKTCRLMVLEARNVTLPASIFPFLSQPPSNL